MIATSPTAHADRSRSEHVSWRQLRRHSTIEGAEADVAILQSQGIDAVLSMIDGLCVLIPRTAKV